MTQPTELIYDMWYVATHGAKLGRGKLLPITMLGQNIVLGRTNEGEVFALRDFCPHRGIPLRYGTFDGKEIECCYHGWKFDCTGSCTKVPSLTPDDQTDISRIKAQSFPATEKDGLIWVYVNAPRTRLVDQVPPVPDMPAPIEGGFKHVDSVHLPCNVDHAVIGLMDPSHGPFVHQAWWWRSGKSMHQKEKKFAPNQLGFSMLAHKPSSNSRAYKILGIKELKTEITFQLPSRRSEHIQAQTKDGARSIVLLTALTPVDEKNTVLHQFFYTNIPLAKLLFPLALPFGKRFIQQDVKVVKMQQEGLVEGHPSLMLIGDADQQARWYFKLKKDYLEAQAEQRPFENRVPEKTLKWVS